VSQFLASTLTWKEKGLTLTQSTNFPDEPRTKLTFTAGAPTALTVQLRHPGWCQQVTVKINGKPETTSTKPGSYIALKRTWQSGDTVEVELPMTMRTELLPGTTDTLALAYGPIVLAGKLGNQGIAPGSDIVVNERTIGSMLNGPINLPVLQGDGAKIAEAIKPVAGQALTFSVPATGGANVTVAPYFRIAHEHYTVYWKFAAA